MMPPAGWYPDPQRPGLQRWWDGAQWVGQPVATPQQPLYGTAASAAGTPAAGYTAPYTAPYGAPAGPWAVTQHPAAAWGAPVPGGYYYAAPKKRSRGWWTGFAVIAVAVVAIIGVGIFFAVRVAIDDVLAPRNAATSYLSDLRDGDYSDAYARLCVADQDSVSENRFAQAFDARHPTSFRITGTSYNDSNGLRSAQVRFNEAASDGSSGAQTLTLIHESGEWRVCHMGQPPSTWAGISSGARDPALPAALHWDASRVRHSH